MTEVKLDLDGLEALAKAATGGIWERLEGVVETGHPIYKPGTVVTRIVQKRAPGETAFRKVALVDTGTQNAAFIAAFNPATALALLALAREAEGQGWRDIESAPKDGTEVLVLIKTKTIRLGWYFAPSSRTEGWCDEIGRRIYPTHWMPLPTPPSRTQSGEDAA